MYQNSTTTHCIMIGVRSQMNNGCLRCLTSDNIDNESGQPNRLVMKNKQYIKKENNKMRVFDKVIGYKEIKKELYKICDMFKNRERYEKLGAQIPHGIIMYGDPGVGKTLMANAFIKESGRPCYTVRRKDASRNFTSEIVGAFIEARANAPSIVLLDDMDKFSNEDEYHRDAEEYVAVQACIDESKDSDVFVIATVNNMKKLPHSLKRSGRFDLQLHFDTPNSKDAFRIIKHYFANKKLSSDVNYDDIEKMMSYSSCAELESIINDSAIRAAFRRKDCIEMKDIVESVLAREYEIGSSWNTHDSGTNDDDDEFWDEFEDESEDEDFSDRAEPSDRKEVALHEAGHLVISELIKPGSVGLATIRQDKRGNGGFIHNCYSFNRRRDLIKIALAGKAAVEMYYQETNASGCNDDISKAAKLIADGISNSGTHGFGMIKISTKDSSDKYISSLESLTTAELEKNMFAVRDMLLKNRAFLERISEALLEKGILLASDIARIREAVNATEAA